MVSVCARATVHLFARVFIGACGITYICVCICACDRACVCDIFGSTVCFSYIDKYIGILPLL